MERDRLMPVDAPTSEPTAPLRGTVRLHREYRDILGRPLTGNATITGQDRTEDGGRIVLPLPVEVDIVNGVLDVHLPPDTYLVEATLRTVEQARATDKVTVTIA